MDRRRSGLTLVELAVVLAILAVLGLVAFVNYRGYIIRAHYSRVRMTLSSYPFTVASFHADFGRFPSGTCDFLSARSDANACSLENGTFLVRVPSRFCVKFQPVDCDPSQDGDEGYAVVVAYGGLRNSSKSGTALMVYRDCSDVGGGAAGIICEDTEVYGQKGDCTGYACP